MVKRPGFRVEGLKNVGLDLIRHAAPCVPYRQKDIVSGFDTGVGMRIVNVKIHV